MTEEAEGRNLAPGEQGPDRESERPSKADIQNNANKTCRGCQVTIDSRKLFIKHCQVVHGMRFKTRRGQSIPPPPVPEAQDGGPELATPSTATKKKRSCGPAPRVCGGAPSTSSWTSAERRESFGSLVMLIGSREKPTPWPLATATRRDQREGRSQVEKLLKQGRGAEALRAELAGKGGSSRKEGLRKDEPPGGY